MRTTLKHTAASSLAGCAAPPPRSAAPASKDAGNAASLPARPAGWREDSHGEDAKPDYDAVFPTNAVKTFTIRMAPDVWQAMQDDLNTNIARSEGLAEYTPVWVPATIEYDGQTWTNVGVRYKGHYSLMTTWKSGAKNLPFKVDFDKFEKDHPEIKNQRYFGFDSLSLANNTDDPSAMRDTLVYDMLGKAGLPAMRTAAYEIMIDHGDGLESFGLYTATEVVDDTGVAAYFGSDKGNLYEGDGDNASLAEGTFDQIPANFPKQNNEDTDFADLQKLYTVLHDARRTSDPEAWRTALESVFNVDGFLEWLGIATVVAHVDTYGFGGHNFYLYNDPATGKLNWISWDHNLTFQAPTADAMPFDRAKTKATWPLIRFLLDDPIYFARYVELLKENSSTVLEPNALIKQIRERGAMLAPYAAKHMPAADYDKAVADLVSFVENRMASLQAFLK